MKKLQNFMLALNLLLLMGLFIAPLVNADQITDTLGKVIGSGKVSTGVANLFKIMTWLIIFTIIGGLIYYYWWTRQFKITIRGYDKSGNTIVPFSDTARLIIKPNQAEMKLRKRKQANVIIADMNKLRHDINLRKVIHVYKFGEVNDYVILDPTIVIPEKETEMEVHVPNPEKKGELIKKIIKFKIPKFELVATESQSKEHAVRDLRDALQKLKESDKRRDYTAMIMYIIIGLTFIIGVSIASYYGYKSSMNYLAGSNAMAEALKQVSKVAGTISQTP